MAENKEYYWLKLNADFFEDDTMQWLEEQKNGKDYIIFYLKLCLKSLQNEGTLIRYVGEKLIPYDTATLAKLTGTNFDTVSTAMSIFLEIGLLSQMATGELYLNQINELIGSETSSAKRMRKVRAKKQLLLSQCDNNVQKSDTEIDKEQELDKDKEIYKKIIDYLNEKAGTNYKPTTPKTRQLIKARLNEGFLDIEFFSVIDTKVKDWLHKKDFKQYLRPQTLFGTNFEGYLNQASEVKSEVINLPFIEED